MPRRWLLISALMLMPGSNSQRLKTALSPVGFMVIDFMGSDSPRR